MTADERIRQSAPSSSRSRPEVLSELGAVAASAWRRIALGRAISGPLTSAIEGQSRSLRRPGRLGQQADVAGSVVCPS